MISLEWLSKTGSAIVGFVPGVSTVVALVTLIFDLGEKMLAGGLNLAISTLSSIDTSAFSNVSFAGVAAIGYANAVFPLDEMISIWTAVASGCLSVVTIRWVKSFIPTVSN